MTTGFMILTVLFIIISAVMILIVLVQRPQGGGLAGAFGGAGGGSTDTVFGGRVGDALTIMTTVAFAAYLLLAIGLNVMDNNKAPVAQPASLTSGDGSTTAPADDAVDDGVFTPESANNQETSDDAPTEGQSSDQDDTAAETTDEVDTSTTPAGTATEAPPGQ
jgi:preprotein translocase subunit SecG